MLALHENALLAKVKAHRLVAKNVGTVASLPRSFGEKLLKQYVADAPAIYVVPGRIVVKDDQAYMEFVLVGVIRNAAGHEQGRKGDGIDLGCDHLLRFSIKAVNRQAIGDATWYLTSAEMADDELLDQFGLSVIEMHFLSSAIDLEADYTEDELNEPPSEDNQIGSFELLHADFDTPVDAGNAEYDSWLMEPPDFSTSRPDLQMDVPLPGATA